MQNDLSCDEFMKEILKWKNEKGYTFAKELKRIGSSRDSDKAKFTVHEKG